MCAIPPPVRKERVRMGHPAMYGAPKMMGAIRRYRSDTTSNSLCHAVLLAGANFPHHGLCPAVVRIEREDTVESFK